MDGQLQDLYPQHFNPTQLGGKSGYPRLELGAVERAASQQSRVDNHANCPGRDAAASFCAGERRTNTSY